MTGPVAAALGLAAVGWLSTAVLLVRSRHLTERLAGADRRTSGAVVDAEERARGQLVADLHDTAAQTLALARVTLGDPARVARGAELVVEAEEQVRGVMARTRPPMLDGGDLAGAVRTLVDDVLARYGLRVRVRWPGEPWPLRVTTATIVYRFFQEALANVVKHAGDEAELGLLVAADELVAVVRDHGPGFDPDRVTRAGGRHLGLAMLRERARLAGGSLQVASWPGSGTRLTLRLPLDRGAPPVSAVGGPARRPDSAGAWRRHRERPVEARPPSRAAR